MNESIGESITRASLEEYFGRKFIKTRQLPWLQNPDGYPLEIDCYNEELDIAVEYQGVQHYRFTPLFHDDDPAVFVAQQERDARKRSAAIDAWVTFIEIPYTIPFAELRAHIRDLMCRLGYAPVGDPMPVEVFYIRVFMDRNSAQAMLRKAHEVAESHGGVCLSEAYVDCHTPLSFVCAQEHPFSLPLASVNHADHQRPRWCPECGGTRKRTFEENTALVAPSGYTLVSMYMRRVGADKGNPNGKPTTYFRLRCPSGLHEIHCSRDNFLPLTDGKPRRSCMRCSRTATNQARGARMRAERAASFGLVQLSPFENRKKTATWRCIAKGHVFRTSWDTVLARENEKCFECRDEPRRPRVMSNN